jgi:hypothetical protein
MHGLEISDPVKDSSLGYLPPAPEMVLPRIDRTMAPWIIINEIDRMIAKRLN